MEELWALFQREYERQQKLRELYTNTGFKRRVDLQLQLMSDLGKNWKKFSQLEQDIFNEFFPDSPDVYHSTKPRLIFPATQTHHFQEQNFIGNEAKAGTPPAYANYAICKFLLVRYLRATGEKPSKYNAQPCIKYVENVLTALKDHVYDLFEKPEDQTPEAMQLLGFKSIGAKCLEVIKKSKLDKEPPSYI